MRLRDVSIADVTFVLDNYDTRRLARQLPHQPFQSEIFIAEVRGRRLRLYVMQGSNPPYIMTVAWEKR